MFKTIIMIMCTFKTTNSYNVALESKSLLQPFEYNKAMHGNFGQSFTFKKDNLHSLVFAYTYIEVYSIFLAFKVNKV